MKKILFLVLLSSQMVFSSLKPTNHVDLMIGTYVKSGSMDRSFHHEMYECISKLNPQDQSSLGWVSGNDNGGNFVNNLKNLTGCEFKKEHSRACAVLGNNEEKLKEQEILLQQLTDAQTNSKSSEPRRETSERKDKISIASIQIFDLGKTINRLKDICQLMKKALDTYESTVRYRVNLDEVLIPAGADIFAEKNQEAMTQNLLASGEKARKEEERRRYQNTVFHANILKNIGMPDSDIALSLGIPQKVNQQNTASSESLVEKSAESSNQLK